MTKEIESEKIFYNAVAIALEGDPEAMRKIGKKISDWEAAYEYFADGGTIGKMEPKSPDTMPDPNLEWENLEQRGIRLVFQDEPEYPQLLREIHNPPLALYILGRLMQAPSITVVGTRRATPDGKTTTRRFAHELASAELTIVSGLALGIDAEAHAGCLETSDGRTIAVLARGVDRIYPAENERLGRQILERGGAIISEYPAAEPPYPYRFLERNRIVSGLSQGVLVVEAPARSGSLATATFALEQSRDVFVVPGPITHPNFFGSHQLIRQGAELVTSPEEILEAYNLVKKIYSSRENLATTPEEKQVLIALSATNAPTEVYKIIELTKLEPRIANQTLSFLLLKNVIKETGSGYIIE